VAGLVANECYVDTGGAQLYVRVVGDGPTAIVIHGGPDFDHSYLLPELDRLAGHMRLVYYDQRGRGRSSRGVQPQHVTIDSEIADLDAVREYFGHDAVVIIGHSWGALIALAYATRRPPRVSRLVLVNPAPVSAADAALLRRSLLAARSPGQTAQMDALRSSRRFQHGDIDADAEYYRIHFAAALSRPVLVDRVVDRLRAAVDADGIVLARAIEQRLYDETWSDAGFDLLPHLNELGVEVLIVHGDHDLIRVEVAHHIADALPMSTLLVLENCGHFAYLEQPDQFVSAVTAFMSKPTDGT